MVRRIIIIIVAGIGGIFCASMQAIAKETSFAALDTRNPPEPDPYRHAVTRHIALLDTTRRPSFAELARLAAMEIITSRGMKRIRRERTGIGKDKKTEKRSLAMKHKNRR
ncbi:MAG: hypothetical protein QG653_418 [Patescibacteria group bacterium]|nr:hypothetical protein [Patescibacteria group bacterium]